MEAPSLAGGLLKPLGGAVPAALLEEPGSPGCSTGLRSRDGGTGGKGYSQPERGGGGRGGGGGGGS